VQQVRELGPERLLAPLGRRRPLVREDATDRIAVVNEAQAPAPRLALPCHSTQYLSSAGGALPL